MPAEKNRLLRVTVPIVVGLIGLAIVIGVFIGGPRRSAPPAAQPAPGAQSAAEAQTPPAESPSTEAQAEGPDTQSQAPTLSEQSADPALSPTTSSGPVPVGTLRARTVVSEADPTPIGDLTPSGDLRLKVEFTRFGAGVRSITMADFFVSIDRKEHYEVQRRMEAPLDDGRRVLLTSLAARGIEINGQFVDLFSRDSTPVWREVSPGSFEAEIEDDTGNPVLRLRKSYSVRPGSFEIEVRQSAENLTAAPMSVVWVQYGPIELPEDTAGYSIDVRRVRFGFLLDQGSDPSQQFVQADGKLKGRAAIVKEIVNSGNSEIWPGSIGGRNAGPLVWVAQTNRYFVFSVHPLVGETEAAANVQDPQAHPIDKAFALAERVDGVVWRTGGQGTERLLLQMTSRRLTLAPGAPADLSFAAYAGPLGRRQLSARADPVFGALGLDQMVIYNLGGMCAFCTFQWLAKGLLWFLTFLHDSVVFDWALAIMVLVVCVRTVLHPITKRSQVGLMRFSKQMQRLAPKQQKLREKYKDDPKRMQQEMMKLMKEEGVSYTGALGCLPMFLQSPIWIALYAMLYFSFDLRHQGAFFGVFQKLSGGRWSFLADLSAADHFIDFGRPLFSIPLMGQITGLNILPLLLGVVFYVQQKYLTPPPSTALSPEQETQQKIMKVMMVVMFPVFMYNAPSGLTIYFITNSILGILESRWIRAHVDRLELEGPPKPGFTERLAKRVANEAAARQQQRKPAPKRGK